MSGGSLLFAQFFLSLTPTQAAAPTIVESMETSTVNGTANVPGRRYTWQDAEGSLRSALMLDQTSNRAGVLRQLKYKVGGVDRVCSAIPSNSNAIQGMGYVVNHLGTGSPWGNWTAGVSTAIGGTTSVVFAGRHHVMIQYSIPNYTLNGKKIPTTVQWMFATGCSHPLFSVTQDARAHTAGNLGADSRSPYGTLQFAGDGLSQDCLIGGVSWGDTFKFVSVQANTTNESTTLLAASGWRYNEANTIPFTMAWASGVNAEQGTVATTSITRQDHGSDPRIYPATGFRKNQQDLDGPMIRGDDWQFQMMNYPDVPASGTYDKKIGWGTNFGMLGGFDNWGDTSIVKTEYSRHRDSVAPWTGSRTSGLFLAYSTFIVLGEHTGGYRGGTTGKVVAQMEAIQAATLTAATGQVKTQGPISPSVSDSPNVTFSPTGYDASYSVWAVDAAASSAVEMTLTPAAAKPLPHPVFRISNYQASAVGILRINGVLAIPDVDFFASLDVAKQTLWLTLNRTVSEAATITLRNPYQEWKSTNSLPSGIADDEDPDADGISILIEYALMLSPKNPDLPPATTSMLGGKLKLAADKNPVASDLTWGAEVSGNLSLWTPATIILNSPTRFEASDTVPVITDPKRFIRLRISHP